METKIDLFKAFRIALETGNFLKLNSTTHSFGAGFSVLIEQNRCITLIPGNYGSKNHDGWAWIDYNGFTQRTKDMRLVHELMDLYTQKHSDKLESDRDNMEMYLINKFGDSILKDNE